MENFQNGTELRLARKSHGLSQAKLSQITGICQATLSRYELGKAELAPKDLAEVRRALSGLNEAVVQNLKKKRFRQHVRSGVALASRPRRSYSITAGNDEYLKVLAGLEKKASSKNIAGPKALSLFAGCGGLCYGVKAAGFRIVGSSEINEDFRKIYVENFPDVRQITNDVRLITEEECARILREEGEIDLMIGGPPCQGFSLAGKRDSEDERNKLFADYQRIAKAVRPKIVLMENVRLLTSMKTPAGKLVSECILEGFADFGYKANFFCINAKDYGVPQHRERVIFVAVRGDIEVAPSVPTATHGGEANLFTKPYRTFGDAVSDLEFLESGEKSKKDRWHCAVSHPDHVVEWLIDVPEGKSAHDNEDPANRPPSGYNTTYKRQVWNEPGGTVATTFSMISGCRNVHPIATRSLTIREAMRLQSFPDGYLLSGKQGPIQSTIGNAVPPLLAYVLASHIRKTYSI